MGLLVTPGTGATLLTQQPTVGGAVQHAQVVSTGAAPSLSTTNFAATTVTAQALAARDERKGFMVQALDGAVYVGPVGVTTSTGFRLQSGDAISSVAFIGALHAVTTAGTTNIRIWEEF